MYLSYFFKKNLYYNLTIISIFKPLFILYKIYKHKCINLAIINKANLNPS